MSSIKQQASRKGTAAGSYPEQRTSADDASAAAGAGIEDSSIARRIPQGRLLDIGSGASKQSTEPEQSALLRLLRGLHHKIGAMREESVIAGTVSFGVATGAAHYLGRLFGESWAVPIITYALAAAAYYTPFLGLVWRREKAAIQQANGAVTREDVTSHRKAYARMIANTEWWYAPSRILIMKGMMQLGAGAAASQLASFFTVLTAYALILPSLRRLSDQKTPAEKFFQIFRHQNRPSKSHAERN